MARRNKVLMLQTALYKCFPHWKKQNKFLEAKGELANLIMSMIRIMFQDDKFHILCIIHLPVKTCLGE